MRPNVRFSILASACLGVSSVGVARANTPQQIDAGLTEVKQLLLLMDTDKNGKVSKQEFMNFMSKEFDRLDVNHDGELDVKELSGLRVRPIPPPSAFHK
jgi:Ca2+-binding EF-hand superfamily protein